jgi:arsenite-transporting ATPase
MALSDTPTAVLPNLFARELDAAAAFAVEKDKYQQAVDDLFASITRGFDAAYDRAVIKDLIELAPPGIDELFAILTLIDALFGADPYDTVIVDTAPTGHTLRLLALPEAALEWVHALLSILLKYRKVIGLGDMAQDLLALAQRLKKLGELLRDPEQAAFFPVTRAAALPRLETTRLVASLEQLKIARGRVIVNAVTEPACARCQQAAAGEAQEIKAMPVRDMLLAPAIYPPPRGASALRAWIRRWHPA